ncbi:mitochondrial import inner membrane translocase subunit TIM50-C-like isoform X1 [Cimex lectularius]|uniref:Mitochondrial import inner membrane translocase subunit TIM50 n=1 Tax=Cimex lectularius TaxID=79782 RepID=A0A8I6TI68_CIMLE|nr:mitochondrial import inner membrane translocase subunit TIM50-C-like isoform X1 [Cimex lectularius]
MASFGLTSSRFCTKVNSQLIAKSFKVFPIQSTCHLCTVNQPKLVYKFKKTFRYRHFSEQSTWKAWPNVQGDQAQKNRPPAAKPEDPERDDDQKNRDESWKKMKYSLFAVFSTIGIGGGFAAYTLGKPDVDENGQIKEDDFSDLPMFKQFFKRMLHNIEYYNKMIKEPSRDKLLPEPLTHPYIQPPYTLVLEMTDLLVHPEWTYQTGWRFKKRPGVDKFLEQVGPPNFEVVVYTAEQGMTVFPILDSLDPHGYIMFRLVRDATDFIDGHHVKNLDCLNRDLKKVIVVDWNPNSVKLHRNNTFLIPRWRGNDDDTTLVDLAAFLKTIASNDIEDVRDVLIYYGQFENPIEAFRINQRKLLEQMEEREKSEKEKKPSFTQPWSSFSFNKR